jgi:5'-nucleotidase
MKVFFKLTALAAAVGLLIGCSVNDNGDVQSDVSEIKIRNISAADDAVADKVAYILEIIHVNDVHSYIDPAGVTLKTDRGMVRVKAGGPEAIKSVIETRKKINPDALVISAGDQITGNAANYDIFHGKADAALHGMYGTDFYVLGNHEFDHGGKGIATFMEYMKELSPKSVLLNSDLTVGHDSPVKDTGVREYFKNVGDRTVVLYGVTAGGKIKESSSPDPDMNFSDTVSTINELTAKNRDKASIHVLVSHQGVIADRTNSALFNDVDIIIGGDSHSLCGNFSKYGLKGECTYPMTRENASGHKICVVQANEYGKIVGDLRVSFDSDGNVLKCEGSPFMPLWSETAYMKKVADPADDTKGMAVAAIRGLVNDPESTFIEARSNETASAAMKPYRDEIKSHYSYLGKAPQDLCSTRFPTDDCVIKNEVNPFGSESCRVFGMAYLDGTDAQILLGNSGGYRVDVESGDFTDATLLAVAPFSNELKTVDMKGSVFVDTLNQVMRYIGQDPAARDGGMPCGYGFSYSVDLTSKNPVTRVTVTDKSGKSAAIDPARTYRVMTNSFLLQGKDGYRNLKRLKVIRDFGVDSDVMKKYLAEHGSLPVLPENSRTITDFKE